MQKREARQINFHVHIYIKGEEKLSYSGGNVIKDEMPLDGGYFK